MIGSDQRLIGIVSLFDCLVCFVLEANLKLWAGSRERWSDLMGPWRRCQIDQWILHARKWLNDGHLKKIYNPDEWNSNSDSIILFEIFEMIILLCFFSSFQFVAESISSWKTKIIDKSWRCWQLIRRCISSAAEDVARFINQFTRSNTLITWAEKQSETLPDMPIDVEPLTNRLDKLMGMKRWIEPTEWRRERRHLWDAPANSSSAPDGAHGYNSTKKNK